MTLRDRIRSSIQLLATARLGPEATSQEPGARDSGWAEGMQWLLPSSGPASTGSLDSTNHAIPLCGSEPLCQIPVQLARVINRKCEL